MPNERTRALRLAAMLGGCLALAGCGGGATGLGLNLVSQEQLADLGKQDWQRLVSSTPATTNQSYQRRAEEVSARLLRAAGLDASKWEVRVFQGEEANAYALPGQKIGVYEGLFRYAKNDAQLAAVVGHEIAHNLDAHAAERVSTQMASEAGAGIVGAALGAGGVPGSQQIAAALGTGAQYGLILPYSRNQELEADRDGLMLMARAGYDPREAVALWGNMRQAGSEPPVFLSTHPGIDDRIGQMNRLMPEALKLYAPK
ncbi:M48 family metallopeptidase [Azospirillum sp. A1-3]|uniref:M48 family metallopeptidase n=1 Tax=Azospirillum sp. A1-3 TaxID=185874 RepID=UPI00207750B6|nr:M48 family metallopeptidase [Azospirillum sp. A1-3]MCM8737842.1 M48 family metallopeptidase [Azospirillum sp. A1-3]